MQLHSIETFLSFQDVEIKLVHHHLTVATIQKGTLKPVSNSETFQHHNTVAPAPQSRNPTGRRAEFSTGQNCSSITKQRAIGSFVQFPEAAHNPPQCGEGAHLDLDEDRDGAAEGAAQGGKDIVGGGFHRRHCRLHEAAAVGPPEASRRFRERGGRRRSETPRFLAGSPRRA
jgi:hypothetical protein